MPSVDAGGSELHYVRAGGGEPLLLIQGMSATHMAWGRPFLSPLEQSFETIVFDNRGMGLSGRAELPFEFWWEQPHRSAALIRDHALAPV